MMYSKFFQNKTILITGSSQGIGETILAMLINYSCNIITVTRKINDTHNKKKNIRNINCDFLEENSLIKSLEYNNIDPNSIDYAILCAGTKIDNRHNCYEDYIKTLKVNLLANVYFCHWIKEYKAHTLIVSSLGRYHGMKFSNGYNSSKAALSIFVESLIFDQKALNKKATFSLIEPGLVRTGMTKDSIIVNMFGVSKHYAAKKILKSLVKKKRFVIFPLSFRIFTFIFANLSLTLKLIFLKYLKMND